ncbi:DNA repair protein RadC [Pseudoxanthomonas sp. GM95]|uniref:RadC family protein n=1 Tax=Pseudoxanthomonas sp. GM95 TaxID=1881043 RepID=UPI0008B178D6|nr:DNA repair protein RadC [Pseudoxanthomonas sp. GM95]SEM58060.1 DNA repair protein RadC [Pseudoxanthomonas sp. GM95]
MSQLSFSSFESLLHVRDSKGHYLLASPEQILEAARDAIDQKMQRGIKFDSPATVRSCLQVKLGGFEHEVFAVLFLDTQHRLIAYQEMFRGTIDSASVHPREVVKEALRVNAAAVILAHNHPSGDPEPSSADRVLTLQLKTALMLMDVRTLDHIVVAGQRTTSFAERGLM